jgi:hypothetical protein
VLSRTKRGGTGRARHGGASQSARLSSRPAIACFIDGRYRDGLDFARTAARQNPDGAGAHHLVVVNSALAGEVEEARQAPWTLKRFEPDLSLETLDMAVYARDEDRRRYFEACRLSGLE